MPSKQVRSTGTWKLGTRLAIDLRHVAPVQKGSMRAFVPPGSRRAVLTDQKSAELKVYAKEIRLLALAELNRRGLPCAYRQPFEVIAVFFLPRALGHFGKIDLRDDAPCSPWSKPDFDKLTRAACDALTGLVWDDDARVVRAVIEKRFASAKRDIGLYFEVRVLPATMRELRESQQATLPVVKG